MIVKDLELHFEVAYDYNTVMKNVMQEVVKQCHNNLYKEIEADIRTLESRDYCKVLDSTIELNAFDAKVILSVDINEEEIGATGEECIAIFKDWSSEIFRMYISMSRVNVEGVIDERVVTAKLVPVKQVNDMLVNDLKLYFEFEVEVRACLPNTGGSVTSVYESPYYMTHSHINSSSQDDLVYADKYQVNVSRQLRKNLRKLEELNYCKVKDYAFDYDGFVVELDVDLDINEHTTGVYGENAIVFFKRRAMPILTQCDDYDTLRDSEGNIVTFAAIHLTLIPIEKQVIELKRLFMFEKDYQIKFTAFQLETGLELADQNGELMSIINQLFNDLHFDYAHQQYLAMTNANIATEALQEIKETIFNAEVYDSNITVNLAFQELKFDSDLLHAHYSAQLVITTSNDDYLDHLLENIDTIYLMSIIQRAIEKSLLESEFAIYRNYQTQINMQLLAQ